MVNIMKKALIFLLFAALGGKICAQEASSSYNVLRLPARSSMLSYGANVMSEVVLELNELTLKQ